MYNKGENTVTWCLLGDSWTASLHQLTYLYGKYIKREYLIHAKYDFIYFHCIITKTSLTYVIITIAVFDWEEKNSIKMFSDNTNR